MTKFCARCDLPLEDNASVGIVGNGIFHMTDSSVSYAIGSDFEIDGLYHPECLRRVIDVGIGGY